MIEQILEFISKLSTPGFFITAEVSREGIVIPSDIERFIREKLVLIEQGTNARKFIYQKEDWRIIFTFFPTDRVGNREIRFKK